jgi:hypothetical protein
LKIIIPISLVAINGDIVFARIRVDKDESSRLQPSDIAGPRKVEVIEEPRYRSVVLASTPLDCV